MFNHEKRRGNCRVKVPSVLQMEAVECGAASLAMILGYYGRFETLEILREQCGVSRDGSKASNILKAARCYGLKAKGYRLELDELKKYTLPMIIHWGFGHFLVLEGFKNNKVYLNDPSEGPRVIDMDELDKMFTGIALVFELTDQFERGGEKFNPVKILWHKLNYNMTVFYYVLVAGLNLLILGCLVPFYSKIYVDEIVLKGRHSWLKPLLIGMAITAILRALFNWVQRHHLLKLELKIDMVSSSAFIWHLLRMPLVFFTQRSSGDLNFRMMRNERVSSIVSNEMVALILNSVMILFFVGIMFHYDVAMTMVALAVTAINILLLKYITQKRNLLYMKMVQDIGKQKSIAMSGIQTIETLKATGSENDFFSMWSGYQAKIVNSEQNIGVFSQKMTIVYTTTTAGLNAVILTMGAFKVLSGEMSIGLLVAYQSLLQSFLAPVSQLVSSSATLQEVSADLGRIEDVMRYPEDIYLKSSEEANHMDSFKRLEGAVELRNITFGYSPLEPPFIENLSLKMEPGSRVALVGGSGSGKSTLSKLVSGLYQPWSGEILFDNINRNELSSDCLKTSFAVVDQEICLFRGSITENISLWDKTLPEAEVIGAAKDAYIHDEITERFGNYNSLMDEGGSNFSGGQRQRIEIARALALKPSILILDEATSALDPKTEKNIDENIRKRGCTCLIIAHRLSTIRDCDEIIVLEKGQIVQRGTHEEMILLEGPYKRLLAGQL